MAELKTKQSDASVAKFLAGVTHKKRRADAEVVCALISKVTGWQPRMWGGSIIGFGAYDYETDGGQKGRWSATGLSPRKTALTIYIMPGFEPFPELMAKLGKYKTGKSCLYVNKLEDIDLSVLEELIRRSIEVMRERYAVSDA